MVTPLKGGVAMMALVNSAFSLDPSDKSVIISNFRQIGNAVSRHLPLYSLAYPRDHGHLDAVRLAIENCAEDSIAN